MFVFHELHRRLLLLGGFTSASSADAQKFPDSAKKLRAAAADTSTSGTCFKILDILSQHFFHYFLAEEMKILTRDALRDISSQPHLCSSLRRAKVSFLFRIFLFLTITAFKCFPSRLVDVTLTLLCLDQ